MTKRENEYPTPQVTINYKLPLWKGEDVTSWLTQMNYAMNTLDDTLHAFALRTSITGDVPEELIRQLEANSAYIEKIKPIIVQVQTDINTINQHLNDNTEDITILQTAVSNLKANYAILDQKVHALEINLSVVENTANKNEQQIEQIWEEIHTIQEQLRNHIADYEETVNTVAEIKQAVEELQPKVSTVETDLDLLTRNFNTATGTIARLSAQVENHETRIEALEQTGLTPEMNEKIATMEQDIKDLQDLVAGATTILEGRNNSGA